MEGRLPQRVQASDDSDADTSSYDDIRVLCGQRNSDDEDNNKDRPSLPPNESHSHNFNSSS
ncbi:hypothetical protein DPMN_143980 [Dreissena polymorpha]|uniref:Uncharacterized protein n=1 Tax=Dreissena polymorpha TaxID=45954 RepID=A0A9D4GEK7_DREPO|nr:hypothetical protein DPMN_143980 [Dreissena polymorpha]